MTAAEATLALVEQVTAAAAEAVSSLHRPMPTTLGDDVFACEHCTTLRKVHIIRWPCPTWAHARKTGIEAAGADNNSKGATT